MYYELRSIFIWAKYVHHVWISHQKLITTDKDTLSWSKGMHVAQLRNLVAVHRRVHQPCKPCMYSMYACTVRYVWRSDANAYGLAHELCTTYPQSCSLAKLCFYIGRAV